MADLPTNYLDDILSDSMGGKRRFKITHLNGTSEEVTIEDISKYDQVGSTFGAGDINKTNQAVNEKFDSDDVVDPKLATEEGFSADAKLTGDALSELNKNISNIDVYVGSDKKLHFVDSEGADSVLPFSSREYYYKKNFSRSAKSSQTINLNFKPVAFAYATSGVTNVTYPAGGIWMRDGNKKDATNGYPTSSNIVFNDKSVTIKELAGEQNAGTQSVDILIF